jgi:DNA polymerase III alpha subunit
VPGSLSWQAHSGRAQTARAADGLTRLALTDTNALYGAVAFARACHAAGIWPITGTAVTVALPDEHLRG